jgi:2,4-dienoyl-CoA reductase-like NADH-dependent reductase (Old Yellow Enzyme family)
MAASLWDTVNIGGLTLRNRAVMPAMATNYATPEGRVTERLKAYLNRRAEGGVGLIVTEVCAIDPLGKGFAYELGAWDDSFLPGLEQLASAIKSAGAAAALQLHHAGRETFLGVLDGEAVAPSPILCEATGMEPRELSPVEISDLVAAYAQAARRAREAGFDAVEVHGAHGYLVNQFLSPFSNKRKDAYGGDAEGRFRFAREIVREIKREAGSDFPVVFRLSSTELVEGGYDLDYILPLMPLLEQDGVDALHVSCGVYDSPGMPTVPGMHYEAGINVERAAAVKQAVNVPVIVVGKLHDPRLADEVIAAGKADMVAFGRQHLADPFFLTKAGEGRYQDIRWCLSCNQGCIERLMFELDSTTCVINPECGAEWQEKAGRRANRGPFLVVGAGPAGLQAAATLSEAEAEVKLVERNEAPGGQTRAATRPDYKKPIADWVDWMAGRLRESGTEIECRRDGAELLASREWAGVVAATGSEPLLPEVPGIDLEINAEARAVLLGQREVGERVLIVGAGPVGMETAEYLIGRGHQVIIARLFPARSVEGRRRGTAAANQDHRSED